MIFNDLLREMIYLDGFLKNFDPKNAKNFLVMSGIFWKNCGEFTCANFVQNIKSMCFFCYKYLAYLNENLTFEWNLSSL